MADTALVQEDGTGLSNANSYATVAQLSTFAADRFVTLTGTYGDETEVLYKAMDFIEQLEFNGSKLTKAQALQFPRIGIHIDGFDYASDDIPQELLDAQMVVAVAIDQGFDPFAAYGRKQKSVKVDVIQIVYDDSSAVSAIDPKIMRSLRKLLRMGTANANNFGVFN